QENLINYYSPAPVTPHESHQEQNDRVAPPPTVAKLEMAAVPPQDASKAQAPKPESQATVESKIQNLISLLAELKPIRSTDTAPDTNRVQQVAPAQAGNSPNPVVGR